MRRESTKKNFAYQMIYELLIILLPIVTSPYIARVVGPAGLGIYSYYYSIAYYFFLFSLLGIKNYGNRSIAIARDNKDDLNKVFSGILILHILLSLVCVIAYAVYIVFFAEQKVYAIIMSLLVLSAVFDISWFYFGIEHFKVTVTINSFLKIISTVSIFLFVKNTNDLWLYCAIIAGSSFLSQFLLWVPLKKYVNIVRVNKHDIFIHAKPLFSLFIPAIAISLYKYMDKIMIGNISSKMQLGFYENSEKIINIPLTIISSFGTVMLPKMSNLINHGNSQSQKYIEISMNYVMLLSFGLAGGLVGISKVFSPVFWGNEFEACSLVIAGLAITIPFNAFANVIRTQYLIPTSKDKEYTVTVFAGAVVNLIVNCMLIGRYGAIGAMIGTIVAELVVCVLQVFLVRHDLPYIRYIVSIIPYLSFSIIMLILVRIIGSAMGNSIVTLFIQVISGAFLYIAMCSLLLWIRKDSVFLNSLNSLRKILRGRNK